MPHDAATPSSAAAQSRKTAATNPTVRLHARTVLRVLLAINALLVIGFLVTKFFPTPSRAINRTFDLSEEASIPAWYSGAMLLTAGLLALLRCMQLRASDVASHWKAYLVIGAALVFLSADEVAQLHETLSGTMHRRAGIEAGVLVSAEIWDLVTFVIYFVAGLILFALLRRDMLALLRESRGRAALIAGAIVFVVGAVVIDQVYEGGSQTFSRIRVALEDGMELTGAALIVYGVLVKLSAVSLQVVTSSARQPTGAAARADITPSRQSPASAYDDDEEDLIHLAHR